MSQVKAYVKQINGIQFCRKNRFKSLDNNGRSEDFGGSNAGIR